MPTISTPSKIAGTKSQGAHVIFSGSTSKEREAMLADVLKQNPGAVVVPPYDHPGISCYLDGLIPITLITFRYHTGTGYCVFGNAEAG